MARRRSLTPAGVARARPLAACLLALAACVGAPATRRPSARDAAVDLAQRLPAGVDQCVVARVGRLAPARRAAIAELSEAGPLAWLPDAPIVAYALGAQPSDDGEAFEAWVRTSVPYAEARRYFEGARRARLRFDEQLLCADGVCRPVTIERVEPTLLRIRRGAIEARGAGRERRCRALLVAHPDALEVAAQLADPFVPGARISSPLATESYLRPSGDGLELHRTERYADVVFAATAARLQAVLPPESSWISVADPIRRVAEGDALRFTARVAWQDLALRAQDVARLRRAMSAEVGLAWRVVPLDAIDVRRLEIVDRQVYIRRERLSEASVAEAEALAAELRALLERVLSVHPQEERFSEALFEILLDPLGDPRAAAACADRALAQHPAEPVTWRRRAREARLRFDPDAVAAALEEAGAVEAGRGRGAARALRALVDADVSYALAEGVIGAIEALERLEVVSRFPEPVRLEWSALPETAVALFELDRPLASTDHLLAWVRGVGGVPGELPQGVVELDRGGASLDAAALWLGDAPRGLRLLGERLGALGGERSLVLAFAVVSEDGAWRPVESMLGLRGRATPQGMRVEAASGARLDWPRIARLLAEPLARTPPRLPPSSFVAHVADDEARTIGERLRPWPELDCALEGAQVVCRSELTGSALRRAWARVVEPLLRRP
jgi:hypothetical protein